MVKGVNNGRRDKDNRKRWEM